MVSTCWSNIAKSTKRQTLLRSYQRSSYFLVIYRQEIRIDFTGYHPPLAPPPPDLPPPPEKPPPEEPELLKELKLEDPEPPNFLYLPDELKLKEADLPEPSTPYFT